MAGLIWVCSVLLICQIGTASLCAASRYYRSINPSLQCRIICSTQSGSQSVSYFAYLVYGFWIWCSTCSASLRCLSYATAQTGSLFVGEWAGSQSGDQPLCLLVAVLSVCASRSSRSRFDSDWVAIGVGSADYLSLFVGVYGIAGLFCFSAGWVFSEVAGSTRTTPECLTIDAASAPSIRSSSTKRHAVAACCDPPLSGWAA